MKIRKSNMTVDGNSVHMSMPFAKIDESKRLVSGYATLDNIDSQGDVVLAEASLKAFARARGNIREMHQPLAVGRMVDFREDEFYSTEEKKFYRGIFVTARVSEGAEDTWKKVLDGTLTGFSIGGEINEASNEFVKDAGTTVRFIKDYDLVELSLVDNPANQLANINSIQKSVLSISKSSDGSTVLKGMAAETEIESVFICKADGTVVVKAAESESCPVCETKMENAGWFETGGDRTEKVDSIVAKFLHSTNEEVAPISDEGGVDMARKSKSEETPKVDEKVELSDKEKASEEEVETPETEAPEGENSEGVDEIEGTEEEGSESPEEVHDDETEISKKIDELHDAVKTSLEQSKNETLEKVAELEKRVTEVTETFITKTSELESKMDEFGEKFEVSKNRLADMESRLEKMNSSEAFKKSADLEEEAAGEVVQKGTSWNGAFSMKPSGFSVDNLM